MDDYLNELFNLTIEEQQRELSTEEQERYIFLYDELHKEGIEIPFEIEI